MKSPRFDDKYRNRGILNTREELVKFIEGLPEDIEALHIYFYRDRANEPIAVYTAPDEYVRIPNRAEDKQ